MGRYIVLSILVACSGLAVAGLEFDNSVNGTSQDWQFDNISFPGMNIMPNNDGNPVAPATAVLAYGPGTGGHRVMSGEHQGAMFDQQNLGISIGIPNYDNANPYKEIYVEFVYWGEIGSASVAWQGAAGMETSTIPGIVDEEMLPDGWKKYSAIWTIEPNPAFETIEYSFVPGNQPEAQLDYILIKTSCIPEPATLLLFGLGGFVLRKKR